MNANHLSRARRAAITLELFVAATLLMAMMGVFAPLTVSSCRVWKDSRHHQLALDELSNQLEELQAMPPETRAEAIVELTPSKVAMHALSEVQLSAKEIDDDDGHRVMVEIDWQRATASPPLRLVSWIGG